MARAGLQHHTRLMAISTHAGKDIGRGVIEVNQNVAGVVLLGIGQKIDVITLLVTCAQKAAISFPPPLKQVWGIAI
jgi:hypothetical protein